MLYITGDVHGEILQRLSWLKRVRLDRAEENFLIVCGDFGLPWFAESRQLKKENRVLDMAQENLERYNTYLYFVDGNHENYDLLYGYPIAEDGTRPLRPRIRHLPRGTLIRIGGLDVFAFGGAKSTDRGEECLGRGYWREELPSDAEAACGLNALETAENVDVVISHAAPSGILDTMYVEPERLADPAAKVLEEYRQLVERKFPHAFWFFGHYHRNVCFPPVKWLSNLTYYCLYENIVVPRQGESMTLEWGREKM